ncbi:HAAS signaling domain-containing protein [Microbacterium esteraromaticum]|uniref:HAAS signaling domain-containing protein n=1 Tax=Microbacterium esteraromaticum TaxID=57043 RepID=UPI00195EC3CC|nr:DUF1700 domain-containing protein [Microbacterium esteraromaticum]MBM7465987.1 hypothetical protein [Microbacterium esteraromaticum]
MNTEDTYLRSVERMLHTIAPTHRTAVLDDLRGHFADAADAGRAVDETIRGLGSPQEIADRAIEEFGADAPAVDARAERAWRVLQGTALGVSIVIGAVAAFIMPTQELVTTSVDPDGLVTMTPTATIAETMGVGAALLALIPALLTAIPLVVPRTARAVSALLCDAALTCAAVVSWFVPGDIFMPAAMLAWSGLIVWRYLSSGRGFNWIWRLVGAVLTMMPIVGFLLILGLSLPFGAMPRRYADYSDVDGGGPSVGIEGGGWVLGVVVAVLAVFLIIGHRWTGWALAAIGAATLVSALISGSLLITMITWIGALWLTIGLSHAIATPRRR